MEIAESVHQIDGVLKGNAFLVVGESLTLVDTGMSGSLGAIRRYLLRLGYSTQDLDMVVVTHHHLDHIGALAQLYRQTPLIVASHPEDTPYVEGAVPPPGPFGWSAGGVVLGIGQRLLRMAPVPVALRLEDGLELPSVLNARVIHTPGHTPGSISLHIPSRQLLLVGDVVVHKWGRLSPPGWEWTVDMTENRRSLEKLAALEPDVIGFGHGPAITARGSKALREFLSRWTV